jgi:hypothetical protein
MARFRNANLSCIYPLKRIFNFPDPVRLERTERKINIFSHHIKYVYQVRGRFMKKGRSAMEKYGYFKQQELELSGT